MLRARRSSMDANADCLSRIAGATQPRPGARAPPRHFSPRRLRAARFRMRASRPDARAFPTPNVASHPDARASPTPTSRHVPRPARPRSGARTRPDDRASPRFSVESRPYARASASFSAESRPYARASPSFSAKSRPDHRASRGARLRPVVRRSSAIRRARTGAPRRASSRGAALPLRRAPTTARPRPGTLSRAAAARASPIWAAPHTRAHAWQPNGWRYAAGTNRR